MKQKCTLILKCTLALILAMLMMVGSISTVVAATLEQGGLAETGADVDIADTGYGTVYLYYTTSTSGTWNSATMVSFGSGGNGTKDISLAANTTYRFVVTGGTSNADWFGNNTFDLSSQTSKTNNLGKYYNFYANSTRIDNSPNKLITSTAGTYTFDVNLSSGSCTVSGGDGGSGGGGGGGGTVSSKVYFVKPTGWTDVYAYFYNSSGYWDSTNGSGSSKDSANLLNSGDSKPGVQMTTTTIDEVTYYVADCPANTAKISFVKHQQDNYSHFWQTEAVYASFDGTTPIITPTTSTYETKNDTKYYEYTSSALPAITTPTITVDGQSSTSSVTASTSANSTVLVTNVNSYAEGTVFKLYHTSGGTTELVDSNTSGTFTVSRNTGTAGTYKVVAVPGAEDTTHSDSADSNTVTLTVTKVAAPSAPTLKIDPNLTTTKVNVGGNVTLTTNYSSFDPSIYDLKIYKVIDNTTDTSTVTTDYKKKFSDANFVDTAISSTDFAFSSKEWAHYKVKAVPKDTTVYTESDYSDPVHVKAIKAQWYAYGNSPFGNGWTNTTVSSINKFYSDEIFYQTFTADDTGDKYFRLTQKNTDGTYTSYSPNTNGDVPPSTEPKSNNILTYDGGKSWKVSGSRTYFLFIEQTAKKVWVRTDLAQITVDGKYQSYTLATDKFGAVTDDATGAKITVNTEDTFVVDQNTAFSVTAHVEDDDYEFLGWYSNTDLDDSHLITTSTKLTVADGVAANTTYYPVARQKVPAKYDVHVDKVDGVTVKATWNSRTASNGRYLSNVPAGATVTISGSSEAGYRFDDLVIKSADGDTITPTGTVKDTKTLSGVTFTMPDSAVTITAKAEEYWGRDCTDVFLFKQTTDHDGDGTTIDNPGDFALWSRVTTLETYEVKYNENDSDKHYYIKIPISYFTTNPTYRRYFGLSNEAGWCNRGKMFWTGETTVAKVAEGSEFYLTAQAQNYDNGKDNDTDNKYNYRYSWVKFNNDAYVDLIDYVLLDVYNGGKTGTYTYSVHFKDNAESTAVSFIAKDGPARKDISGSDKDNDQKTLGVIGSTWVTATGDDDEIGNQTIHATFKDSSTISYYTGALTKGVTYTFHTKVRDTRFYVKAFNVNGVTVAELSKPGSTPEANAEYSCEYTVPNDAPSVLEITPIYFHYDDSNCVTFYLEGYDEVIQDELGWGDTPYIYPYYATQTKDKSGGASAAHNAFGAYCGQPMITAGGVYYTQIPLTNFDLITPSGTGTETGTNIKGITISNGWYDTIHRDKEGWADDDTLHMQTYDYDDFQKIFVEKNPTNIYYQMKLREDRDNAETYRKGNVTSLTSANIENIRSNGNGWELLRDRHNRVIDLFGTPLTSAQMESEALYVISTGYRNNIAGDYGTEWRVYKKSGNTYQLQTADGERNYAIPPSLLFVNEADNLSNAVYPKNTHTFSFGGLDVDAPNDNPATYEAIYNKLKIDSSNAPVYITYEKNDRITKSNYGGSDTTMYGPYRLDGRWFYTSAGDEINSNIEIEYLDGAGGYKTDKLIAGYKGKDNLGEHTGSKAYFTGEFDGLTNSGKVVLDKTKNFTMRAEAGDGYEFVGWYIKQDKAYVSMNPTDKTASSATTMRNGSATYVARFKKLTTFNLTVANRNATGVAPDGNTYNGSGAGLVTVYYKFNNSDEWTQVGKADSEDSITIGNTILSQQNLIDYPEFQIKVVLGNTPDGEDSCALYHNLYRNRYVLHSATPNPEYVINAHDLFLKTTIEEQEVYTQKTYSLLFDTYFNEHIYEYTIRYLYVSSRIGNAQKGFTVKGTFTANMKSENVEVANGNEYLTDKFIESVRPTLSNFRKDMTFAYGGGISKQSGKLDEQDNTKTIYGATVTYDNVNDNSVNITLLFPYQVINRADGSFDFTPQYDGGVVKKDQTEGTILVQLADGYERYLTQNGTATDTVSGLLTAPASILNDATPEYFQYWKVTDPAGEEAIRVYNPMFNYRLFDNYRIEPIYGAVEVSNPNVFAAGDQKDISISYLGTTRNQWNNTNGNDYTVGIADADKASDILFNDFELNYAYENRDVKSDNGITKLGVVIEKIGEVQKDSTGSPILDMSYYSAVDNSENVKSFAETAEDKATGTAGSNSVKNYTINKNLVNNKNRVEFYYNTYNAYGDNDHGDGSWKYKSNVKNNVYRAYTYMIVDGVVIISSKPAYFTMYGEAV